MNISVKNLSKSYIKNNREIQVIKDFTYFFNSGNMYLLNGESGIGKTTLLTLLGLLQKEDKGEILFDGKIVNNLSNDKKCSIRRKHIGIVFQDLFCLCLLKLWQLVGN
ncbi:Lipoprotein-releasing system ATP-binding protein lolD [Proteiniborus sp. DW1]|uniref:ATP-binding cassette domain-containing protein n=1 Tax=Proteiniborus sp. DW1 TaxID=1889883 RepID=UPI00092E0DED|nr:ATP-binding cassette domain-containing protein [Proteiniborus sp. DW1]SCG81729.1 Lipoprotein-releasing system ATP-binding protein lolD [Proteiniborus sp. DW1]